MSKTVWVWIGVAVLLLGAAGYVAYLMAAPAGSEVGGEKVRVPRSDVVQVPDLSGLTEEDAVAQLTQLGLTSGTVTVFDSPEDTPVGSVISQVPAPGTDWIKGQPVGLAIAGGKDDGTGTTVPSVQGSSFDQASQQLANSGLLLLATSDDPEDLGNSEADVVEQLPEAGVVVPQGSTVVARIQR